MSHDDRSSEELFRISFEGDEEDEKGWDAVASLRLRNTEEVFQSALTWLGSAIPKHRSRALDVLAQLGAGRPAEERVHLDECVSIALAHLHDEDPVIAHSAAWALAHLEHDERSIAALIETRHHSDPGVRWAVTVGVAGCERPEVIHTLIELTEDSDDEVRNWATFGLGTQCATQDSEAIRQALGRRLHDSFVDASNEAIWGLALRRDPEGLRLLHEHLDADEWVAGDEMAAAEILGADNSAPADELRAGLRNLLPTA